MCSAWTSISPSAVNRAAEQSARSLMLGLNCPGAARAHLLGHAGEAGDQDLEGGRVEAHAVLRGASHASGPWVTVPMHSKAVTTMESRSELATSCTVGSRNCSAPQSATRS